VWEELDQENRVETEEGTRTVDRVKPSPQTTGGTNTRGLALIAVFTALYVVASAIPIDAFIGGAGFITVAIILLPVMAKVLRPREAVVMGAIAGLGIYAFQLSVVPILGFFGLLVPSLAIVLGALGFHKSPLIPAAYVLFGMVWYILFSGGTAVWLAPYVLVVALSVALQAGALGKGMRLKTVVLVLDATMCELVTLNIGSISVLHLPGALWTVITPFMFLERTVAVVGGSSLLFALARVRGPLLAERV
jgi:hypothetical protein